MIILFTSWILMITLRKFSESICSWLFTWGVTRRRRKQSVLRNYKGFKIVFWQNIGSFWDNPLVFK